MGFKALEDAIKDASQKYYTDGSSPVTDEQFDSMLDELKNKKAQKKNVYSNRRSGNRFID